MGASRIIRSMRRSEMQKPTVGLLDVWQYFLDSLAPLQAAGRWVPHWKIWVKVNPTVQMQTRIISVRE
jgi:hypothetical protein